MGLNPVPLHALDMYSPGKSVEASPGRHVRLQAAQVVSTVLSGLVVLQGTLVMYLPTPQLAFWELNMLPLLEN